MKSRMTLSIVLALSIVIASLTSSDSTVNAQNQVRPVADTGVITLGPNQVLRVTVAAGDVNGDGNTRVRFRQTKYEMCQASPKLWRQSQTTTPTITLAPSEAWMFDWDDPNFATWRTVVLSDNRNVRVLGIVFDTSTQRVVSQIIVANTAGDYF